MEHQADKQEIKIFDKIGEDISAINTVLTKYEEELKLKDQLTDKINEFIINYQKFERIKRFSIPVIGKINCGKSTILNYLLNLDDVLEYSCDITTKFISIIRHNKDLKGKSPLIYNVKFEQRAYINNKYLYNFEKDGKYIEGNIKDIIKKRNEQLSKNELDKFPENYFYIIECYIPLFEGELEKYADYYEFMDVPGLNEASSFENLDNIYLDKILPLFVNNVQFAIFIFDALNYEKNENSAINSRDIFIDFFEKMKEFFSNKNKNQVQIHDSILVLNKIDLSNKEGGLNKEKSDFSNYLESKLNIPIRNNAIVLFQADLEYLKKNRFESFEKYIDYTIKFKKDDNDNNFNIKLKMNFKNDFNINNNILQDENEDEEDEDEDEEEEIQNDLSESIKKINKSLSNQSYSDSLTKKQYLLYKNFYDNNKVNAKQKFEANFQKDDLSKNIENSIKNAYNNFINNYNQYKKLYEQIILELNIKKDNILNINDSKIILSEDSFKKQNYKSIFNCEKSIFEELKGIEPNHEFIKNIYNNFIFVQDYIEKWHKYNIAIFGEHSSGKTSLLNSLIGFNILPESNAHCTKIILAIQYTESKEDLSLYSAKFNKNKSDEPFLYFIPNELIAKGEEKIKQELKNINNNEKQGIHYYLLNTPIKFLDLFIEDKNIKEKIQFIDTPGLDSLLKEYTDREFPKLIKYVDLFIYTNTYNIINQKESEMSLKRIIEFILDKKGYFDFNSFIFIVNFYDKLNTNDEPKENEILENYKNDIIKIIKKYKENNWDAYINKYKKIIYNDSNISCFYFSKIIFNDEQDKMNKFLDFNNFFTTLNNESSNLEIKKKLSKINAYIKKNYLNKLSNNKEFSKDNIQITDKDRKDLKKVLNINENDFESYKNNLDDILAKYNFIKNNLINFWEFKDFLSTFKEKLSKENIYDFLSYIMFEISLKLIRYFELIENNILKWESGQNNEIPINIDIKTKYDWYKKEIEDNFIKYKKEIEKNFNDIYEGKDERKKINENIKNLLVETKNIYNSYLKYLKKESDKINKALLSFKKYDMPLIINNKRLFSFPLNTVLLSLINFMPLFDISSSLSTEEVLLTIGFTSFITGGVIDFGIWGIVASLSNFIANNLIRFIDKMLNKKKIQVYYNDMMDRLQAIKYKVNDDMDSFYNSIKIQIDEILQSLKEPMKNIIENKINRKMFFELKDNCIKFLLNFNNINNK